MDFGSDVGWLSPPSNTTTTFATSSDPETKQKWYGSVFFKQERSNSSSLFSAGQPQMLSFSSPNLHHVTLPYYHQTASPYARNTGYGSGGLNAANIHGMVTGVKGPFTPSQWMELEHQALIYNYITANSPVPSNLLNPIRKALESAGFSSFPSAHLRPNTLGWGAFHLGFSNNTNPEPGRCRRTDGKKWRCSRNAVADQKYCERHVYRGRHRSRKPVEGQTAHSFSRTTSTTAKLLPMSSSSSAASVVPASGTSNSLGLSRHQLNSLQHGAPNPSASPHLNRSYMSKANVGEKIQEQQGPYHKPSRTEFGLVCSDSLLNPFQKSSSLINCRSYGSTDDLNDCQNKSQHSLLQFMDDWPKNQSRRTAMSWPDIDMQSDRTQLSISIPMAASDFMSSTSSLTNEKLALSPRSSRVLDSTQMGLGMNAIINETNQRQANWIPVSWENTMGGPLGEVLNSTNNSAGDCKNTSALNLMTEGWDSSPRLASSPTGVLQKTTFQSLSNSSAGSSPRTENNLLGKKFSGASLPAL